MIESADTKPKEFLSLMIWKTRHLWIVALIVFVLVLAVFSSALKNDFNVDDHFLVKLNPVIRTLNPATHLSSPFWSRWHVSSQYYRPLVTWSLALDRAIYGETPVGFHLTNILLHAVNAFLFFLLLRRISGDLIGIIGTLFFSLHPAQVESVVFILGRTDLLCVLFLLLTACLYAQLSDPSSRKRRRLFIISLITFSLALFCKELAVTFPAMALAIDLARSRDKPWRLAIPERLRQFLRRFPLYLVIILVYLLIRYLVIGQLLGTPTSIEKSWQNPLFGAVLGIRLLTAVNVAFRYLMLVIFPRHLSIDYGYDVIPLVPSALSSDFVLPFLVLLSFAAVLFFLAWRRPASLFGAISLSGAYLLISHIFFPAPIIMAERFLYLPMIGLSALLATVLVMIAEISAPASRRTHVSIILILMIIVPLTARSIIRISDWRNDLTLFSSATKVTPRSAMSWNNLGVEQKKRKDFEEAIRSFQNAVKIFPDFSNARVNLAISFRESGDLESAEKELREGIRRSPEEIPIQIELLKVLTMKADKLSSEERESEAEALRREVVNRGQALREDKTTEMRLSMEANLMLMIAQNLAFLGENIEAKKVFEAAITEAERELAKEDAIPEVAYTLKAGALGTFAWFLGRTGRHREAAGRFAEASEAAKRAGKLSTAARMEIDASSELLHAGELKEALEAFHRALELAGDNTEIKNKARETLVVAAESAFTAGRIENALTIYSQLLEKYPQFVRARHGQARTKAAAGDLEGAEQDLTWLSQTSQPPRLSAAIWIDLAMISMQRNDLQETLRRLDQAISFDPGFAEALYRRGLLKAQLGKLEEAEKDLIEALDASLPDIAAAEILYHLARIAYQRGNLSSAREHLRRCLALQPEHAQARALLKQINR
jgi:tetratricopeptide (TPR) repeat protein